MIPVAEPCLSEEDIAQAYDCLKSGWISSAGKNIEKFESSWAAYCQRKHGIAVCNGSVALDVAVKLLDLSPGDEIIMPSFTIICCAQSIIINGGIPILVDQRADNWQMDISQIESKITDKTKAIMVVHIYGHPVDMDPVLEICKRHNLKLIEDAAECHGALYKGKPCGSFGDISTFSFFANKLITTGEGGMVLVNDDDLAKKARSYRNLCFEPQRRFFHNELGQNYRMTNLQAAIGLNQVTRIEKIVEKKRAIAHKYQELLRGINGITLAKEESWARNVYWIFGILLDEKLGDDCLWLTKALAEKKIETRPFFLGMHEQPVFDKMGLYKTESYPVAANLARRGFYIPSGLTIKDEEINYVANAIQECL
jgi:perosamine synthetase